MPSSRRGSIVGKTTVKDDDNEETIEPRPKRHRIQSPRKTRPTTSLDLDLDGQQLPLPPPSAAQEDEPTQHQNGHQNHHDTTDKSDGDNVDRNQKQTGQSNGCYDDDDDAVSLDDERQARKKKAFPAGQLITRQYKNDPNAFLNKSIELLKLMNNPNITLIYNPEIRLPRFKATNAELECELITKKYEKDLLKPPTLEKGHGQLDKKKFFRGTFRKEDIERILNMTYINDKVINPQKVQVKLSRMSDEMEILRIEELKKMTICLYKPLVAETEQLNFDINKIAWNENLQIAQDSVKKYSTMQDIIYKLPPNFLSTIKLKSKSGNVSVNFSLNDKPYKISVYRIPHVRRLPVMNTFCYTERNYGVDKDTFLTNLPYFPEYETDDPKKVEEQNELNDEILHLYDYKYHKEDSRPKISNYVLYHLVQKLSEFYDNEYGYNGERNFEDDKPKRDLIFRAISSAFPLFGFPLELKDQYINNAKEFDPTAHAITSESLYTTPNMDGPNAIRLPRMKVLNSYIEMFCRRCYQFDCVMHPTDDRIATDKYTTKKVIKPNEIVCKKHDGSKKNCNEWSPADENLLEVVWPTCPENFCALSDILGSRSCHEIKEHCQATNLLNNSLSSVDDNDEGITVPELYSFEPPLAPKTPRGYTSAAADFNNDDDEMTTCYVPCLHPELPCIPEVCNCARANIKCEKFCTCSPDCRNKWRGCKCKKGNCASSIHKCPCFKARRECDVDLCHDCGSNKVDPNEMRCKNVNIQRATKKLIVMGRSAIAGWGAFAGEPIKKNQFIMEYTGEVLINEECSKRALVYDKKNHTFLFKLNAHRVVDATRKGNTIRFANSSATPNIDGCGILVYGDMHIGVYAKKNIEIGEELFLDYNDAIKLGKKKPLKKGETADVTEEVKRFRPKALKNVKSARKFAQLPEKPVPLFTLLPEEVAKVEALRPQLMLPPSSTKKQNRQNASFSSNTVGSSSRSRFSSRTRNTT